MNRHPTSRPLAALLAAAGLAPDPAIAARCATVTVRGIATDSRAVEPGDLFVAIPGLHTDARTHIPAAIAKGAAAVVTEVSGDPEKPLEDYGKILLIPVPSARVATACLYDAWHRHPGRRLRLVGVTGTNGKTSVTSMLRHILTTAGIPCGIIGTVGCIGPDGDDRILDGLGAREGMTTPDPAVLYPLLERMAASVPPDATERPVVVMEVTSHALALGKVAPLTFDVGVFTNLTPEHLDLHGGMDDYFAAKRRLFEVSREAVLNADDRWGRMLLAEPLPVRHWHICHAAGLRALPPDRMCPAGEGGCTRLYAEQVKVQGEDGISFKLTTPDVRLRLRCPVPGEFTVMNALEASAAALALGVSPAAIRDGLAAFPGVPGRMERVIPPHEVPFSVFIDFAHTPDALEQLLGTVQAFRRRDRRIVLLFGCGGDRDRSKRKSMARVASRMADSVVITSDNSRSENPGSIIADILSGMDKESEFAVVPDRAEAIRYAIRHARVGDIILLAGKGHETYEITATGTHPFSEREIACAAVNEFWGEKH